MINNDMPLTQKDGQTPDRDLSNIKSPPRDVARLPGGIPGWASGKWVAVPQWPALKDKTT